MMHKRRLWEHDSAVIISRISHSRPITGHSAIITAPHYARRGSKRPSKAFVSLSHGLPKV
jgi:hypothetical protein